jgi:mRNA interferase MazF
VLEFGAIVLTRFPFTDLSGDKRRPALVVSCKNERRADIVVCFIASVLRSGADMAPISASQETGLKVPSVVRFDKLATLEKAVVTGKLGDAPAAWLRAQSAVFFGVFGFDPPGGRAHAITSR